MRCPNCNQEYEAHETICKNCHAPLSNATYVPVKKKRIWPLVLAVILFILIFGGIFGYKFYLTYVEDRCIEATDMAFSCAKKMDFSDIPQEYLPALIKEEPNVKMLVKKYLDEATDASDLLTLLKELGITVDTDLVLDEIADKASYEIIGVETTYNSCKVTVRTSNLDFSSLPKTVYTQATEEMNKSGSFWHAIGEKITDFIFGHDDGEEEKSTADQMRELIDEIYQNAKENCPTLETTGTIQFGLKDKSPTSWSLLSVDEDLFYAFYGIDKSILNTQE